MITRAVLIAAVIGCSTTAATAWGQEGAELRTGDRIRLWKDGQGYIGTLIKASEDEVVYRSATGSTISSRPSAFASLEVSDGIKSKAGKGALVGAGVGLALGLLGVLVAASDEWSSMDVGEATTAMLVYAAGGGVLGLAIGAAIRGEEWTAVPSPWVTAHQGQDRSVAVVVAIPIGR